MNQEETYALVIVNIIGVFLFGRLYFGSFKKTLIVLIGFFLGSDQGASGLRGSMSTPEPSELLFFFFCAMLIAGEMVWLFLP